MNVRRRCDTCQTPLPGRKGHGFPMADGRGVQCGYCFRPGTRRAWWKTKPVE